MPRVKWDGFVLSSNTLERTECCAQSLVCQDVSERPRSFCFWGREGQRQMKRGVVRRNPVTAVVQAVGTGVRNVRTLTRDSLHPIPKARSSARGQRGVDGRARRHKAGKRAVRVSLWRADACAQGVPVTHTACVRGGQRVAHPKTRFFLYDSGRHEHFFKE